MTLDYLDRSSVIKIFIRWRKQGYVITEVEVRVLLLYSLLKQKIGHKPRKTGTLQKPEKARKWIRLQRLQKMSELCQYLDFSP